MAALVVTTWKEQFQDAQGTRILERAPALFAKGQSHSAEQQRIAELERLVRRVLWHEVAHYLGIDDGRLREIGAY